MKYWLVSEIFVFRSLAGVTILVVVCQKRISLQPRYLARLDVSIIRTIAVSMSLLLGLAVATHNAGAAVINVDFSTVMNGTSYSATASPLAYTGSTWNDVGNGGSGSASLLDSTGAGTGATISWSGVGTSDTNTNSLLMLHQCIYTDSSQVVTIGGLDNSKTYNLYMASAWKDVWGATFTVGANSHTSVGTQGSTWVDGTNYVVFPGVQPTGNQIAITFAKLPGQLAIFNGLQIQSVPEPSTVILLGMSTLGLCLAGRRCRRA